MGQGLGGQALGPEGTDAPAVAAANKRARSGSFSPMASSVTTVISPSPPSGTSGPAPPPAHPARFARALAGCGHEGDDPATLEEAEDALTGTLDDLLDVLLGGCRRGVEHPPLAVSVWRANTVEKQAMEVWIAPEVTGGAMNGGDRAALAAGKSAVSLALAIPPGHSVLATSSVLMRAIKRSWDLHLVQRISIPNVRRNTVM